jgi:hypothetical protein
MSSRKPHHGYYLVNAIKITQQRQLTLQIKISPYWDMRVNSSHLEKSFSID